MFVIANIFLYVSYERLCMTHKIDDRKDVLSSKVKLLCSQHLLDCVAGQGVEKEGDEQGEENEK